MCAYTTVGTMSKGAIGANLGQIFHHALEHLSYHFKCHWRHRVKEACKVSIPGTRGLYSEHPKPFGPLVPRHNPSHMTKGSRHINPGHQDAQNPAIPAINFYHQPQNVWPKICLQRIVILNDI